MPCRVATFARSASSWAGGTSWTNPVRTNPQSPTPTTSDQSRKYGNYRHASRVLVRGRSASARSPSDRPVASPAMAPRSTTRTLAPRRARWNAQRSRPGPRPDDDHVGRLDHSYPRLLTPVGVGPQSRPSPRGRTGPNVTAGGGRVVVPGKGLGNCSASTSSVGGRCGRVPSDDQPDGSETTADALVCQKEAGSKSVLTRSDRQGGALKGTGS